MKLPNDMVQTNGYFRTILYKKRQETISRKVSSKRSESKRSINVLNVLEERIIVNGKPINNA